MHLNAHHSFSACPPVPYLVPAVQSRATVGRCQVVLVEILGDGKSIVRIKSGSGSFAGNCLNIDLHCPHVDLVECVRLVTGRHIVVEAVQVLVVAANPVARVSAEADLVFVGPGASQTGVVPGLHEGYLTVSTLSTVIIS